MEVPAHLPVGPPSAPLVIRAMAAEMRTSLNQPAPLPPSLSPTQHDSLISRCDVSDVRTSIAQVADDRELAVALRKRWDEWAQYDPDREFRPAKRKRVGSSRPPPSRKGTLGVGDDDEQDDEDGAEDEEVEETPKPKGPHPSANREGYKKTRSKKPAMKREAIKTDASVLAGEEGEAPDIPWWERMKRLDDALPPAFRFHERSDLMARHCQREPRELRNALKVPVDVHNIVTQRPGNLDFLRAPKSDRLLLSAGQPRPHAKMPASTPPLILRISVFSRRTLPLTEGVLSSLRIAVAKEQGTQVTRGGDATADAGGEKATRAEEEGDVHGDADGRTESHIGDRSTLYGRVSHTQTLEIRSDASLLELRNAIVCRLDDVPERKGAGKEDAQAEDGDRADDDAAERSTRMKFTGKKRETDSAMLIEGVVYSELKGEGRYAELMADFLNSRGPIKTVEGKVVVSPCTMSQIKLDSLDDLRAGKPYVFFHQGSCEHLWAIQSVRLPHRTDVRLPNGGLAPSTYGFPLTLHLSAGHLQRLVVKTARFGSKGDSYCLDRCGVCKSASVRLLVVGGERVRLGSLRPDLERSEEEGEEGNVREEMIRGLPQAVTGVCAACWEHMTGLPESRDDLGEEAAAALGFGHEEEQASKGKKASRDLPLPSSADASGTTWAGAGGQGWTIIPILD